MVDGVSFNIATNAITALGSGGIGAAIMYWARGGAHRKDRPCADCPEHTRLEDRVLELERQDAAQTALLQSIDERLKTLNDLFLKQAIAHGK